LDLLPSEFEVRGYQESGGDFAKLLIILYGGRHMTVELPVVPAVAIHTFEERHYTVHEVARILNASRDTVRRLSEMSPASLFWETRND
jgi:hypothetical protein